VQAARLGLLGKVEAAEAPLDKLSLAASAAALRRHRELDAPTWR